MQPEECPDAATIQIDVARQSEGLFLPGTFNRPPALVRVKKKTNVQWELNKADPDDSFIVSFANGSPFEGISAISDRTGPLAAVNEGLFHYQVFVVDGATGVVHAIQDCPVIQVDD
jgi:hypothetical protein